MFFDIEVLRRLIERRTGARRVLVGGDLILEVYLKGHVARVSPEATVPVVHLTRREDSPGGAGNVMLNLVHLGMDSNGPELTPRLAQLQRERLGVPRLVLAGKSRPTPADWAHAVALGVADHVEVRQDVPTRELAELYRAASLFVLSLNEEGLGVVLLEAMASGLPVVSTRCGGPEMVVTEGQTGFLVPVGDAPALAARIGTLLDSAAMRRAMGTAGRRVVVERFSLDAAARPFLQTYDELLAGAGDLCVASRAV
ncbi:MAG: glycosyltransferase [Mycobacterium sp.]